jgi:glycosyltransferase involved in cell wall biosynthesis
MPPDPISVTLAVGSAPYEKTLASSLLRAGMLRRVCDLGPCVEIREPDGHGSLKTIRRFSALGFSTRAAWAIWRRLPKSAFPWPPIGLQVCLADRMLAKWIVPSTIFHGCTGVCLTSLQTARRQGSITLVKIAARHPRHWEQTRIEESQRLGIKVNDGIVDLREKLFRRREREFDLCDWIVVPSSVARQSFVEMGYGEKTKVVPTGVDADFFRPKRELSKHERIEPRVFRVCFVGRVEPAKGVGYLLEAWKRLALPRAELLLVGTALPQMEPLLRTYANCNVRVTGFLSPQEVARCYRESSLLVHPSPNEGLARVLLEAMASGLPAVTTSMTGAGECMTDGKQGLIVPARDVDALADAILWCYRHPDEIQSMGHAARARIENEFTLDHYNQRVIALYRTVAGTRPGRHLQ